MRRKVGVITRAEIVGRNLELGGYLFARDFPEIVEEIAKSRLAAIAGRSTPYERGWCRAGVIHAAVNPWESASWEGRIPIEGFVAGCCETNSQLDVSYETDSGKEAGAS